MQPWQRHKIHKGSAPSVTHRLLKGLCVFIRAEQEQGGQRLVLQKERRPAQGFFHPLSSRTAASWEAPGRVCPPAIQYPAAPSPSGQHLPVPGRGFNAVPVFQENVQALTRGNRARLGYPAGTAARPPSGPDLADGAGKPWKRHGNRNKKQKLRRLTRHLEA